MAKTYAESVKLPNLVTVVHPAVKSCHYGSRNGLNVEGRNGGSLIESGDEFNFRTKSVDRRSLIAELLDGVNGKNNKKNGDVAQTNCDQIMSMVDEKLTTGYHGIKHLFNSNDPLKSGRVTKEGFRYILNQLCGYISPEAWNKLVIKFDLHENDTISFEDFLSRFDSNQRVRKELHVSTSPVRMIDFQRSYTLATITPSSHKKFIPELTNTYCFTLLKQRVQEPGFDPRNYLPRECFENNKVVLSYHLKTMLYACNLKLSNHEFVKLWQRFDLGNVGGIPTTVFLRQLGYQPDELDEFASSMEPAKPKRSTTRIYSNRINLGRSLQFGLDKAARSVDRSQEVEKKPEVKIEAETSKENAPEAKTNEFFEKKEEKIDAKQEEKAVNEEKPVEKIEQAKVVNEKASNENTKPESSKDRVADSSLSDRKIKFMVRVLKSTKKFNTQHDLVGFLNARFNEGYISFKTAFEYIDTDRLNHLLVDEFKVVLDEFNVSMDMATFDRFVKKYNLLKNGRLIDYNKFLQTFQEKEREFVKKNSMFKNDKPKELEHNEQLKRIEKQLKDLFHETFLSTLQLFRDSIGATNQIKCSQKYFKRLLEQKFSIVIGDDQFDGLLEFLNQKKTEKVDTSSTDESMASVEWFELFKKFTEIDPWKNFRDTCDKTMVRKKKHEQEPVAEPKKVNIPATVKEEKVAEEVLAKKEVKVKSDDEEIDSSDDEKLFLDINSSSDDEYCYLYKEKAKKFLKKTNKTSNQYLQLTRDFQSDELKIKNLESQIQHVFKTKFHSINKQFSILDSKQSEKITKSEFKSMMQKLGLSLSEPDLNLLWKDLDDSVLFSNLVRRFFKPDEFYRLRTIKHKIKLEKRIKDDQMGRQTNRSETVPVGPVHISFDPSTATAVKLTEEPTPRKPKKAPLASHILDRARLSIVFNWKDLKKEFQKLDRNNTMNVPNTLALELLKKHRIDLNDEELFELVKDYTSNISEFDYIRFLKQFNPNKYHQRADLSSNPLIDRVVKQMIKKARENNKINNKSVQITSSLNETDLTDLKVLFKRFDGSKRGQLTHGEFKSLLSFCQINTSQEDEYAILSEFDPELKSVFNYNLLLRSLIDKLCT